MVRGLLFDFDILAAHPLPTRGVQGLLRVQMPIDHFLHDLHMSLRLHPGTHRNTVLRQEHRNDRVVRALATQESIFVVFVKLEVS